MKTSRFLSAVSLSLTTAFASLLLVSLSAHAGEPIINLSVSGEIAPGTYGQVRFSNAAPPPPVVYAQPMVIAPQPAHVHVEPIYLHVPPGHAKRWSKHCHQYNACNRPVYFVKSDEYEPDYGEHKGRPDEGRGHGHGHGHGHKG